MEKQHILMISIQVYFYLTGNPVESIPSDTSEFDIKQK